MSPSGEVPESTSSNGAGHPAPLECFVVSPIGSEGDDVRRRSDLVLDYVIRPALIPIGFIRENVRRADHIAAPGLITTQILDHILNDDLVVADLTGSNANVYYEVAVRHMLRKPFVQIVHAGEQLPFDISALRTVFFDYTDLRSVDKAKQEIEQQARKVLEDPSTAVTPLSITVNREQLRSDNPLEAQVAILSEQVARLSSQISSSESAVWNARSAARRRDKERLLEERFLEQQRAASTGSGVDLMAALRASLERAQTARAEKDTQT